MHSFTKLISVCLIVGLLHQNHISVADATPAKPHLFKERQLAVVETVLIGISFFTIGFLAGCLTCRNKKKRARIGGDNSKLRAALKDSPAGRIFDFFGQTFAKDVKNRCMIVFMRDESDFGKANTNMLKHMCLVWSSFIVMSFQKRRDILEIMTALIEFEVEAQISDVFAKSLYETSIVKEEVKTYFFERMYIEIGLALGMHKSDAKKQEIDFNLGADEEFQGVSDIKKSIEGNNFIDQDMNIGLEETRDDTIVTGMNESLRFSTNNLPSTFNQSLIQQDTQNHPWTNKLTVDEESYPHAYSDLYSPNNLGEEEREQLIADYRNKRTSEVEDEINTMMTKEKSVIQQNYEAIINFKLLNEFYLPFFNIFVDDMLDNKFKLKKYSVTYTKLPQFIVI